VGLNGAVISRRCRPSILLGYEANAGIALDCASCVVA
jgi:hypothetical protein